MSDRQAQAKARLDLGKALRVLRKNAGLTQEEVAHDIGMKPSNISEVENGHRGLRWYTVLRYVTAVNANLRELADEIEKNPAATSHTSSQDIGSLTTECE